MLAALSFLACGGAFVQADGAGGRRETRNGGTSPKPPEASLEFSRSASRSGQASL
jgi:hypothetical protein